MAAEKPTKPRRDLRARLGKTITPKTAGAEAEAEAASAAPVVAAAAATAAAPAPKIKSNAPPAPGGIAAPPSAIGSSGPVPGVGIAAPPFARPAASPFAPPQPEPPADPFAAKQVAQQVVRIEFDERAVADHEVGRTRVWIMAVAGLILLAVGAGGGIMLGQTMKENAIFDRTVRDTQEIYASVTAATRTLEQAQTQLRAIVTSARGNSAEGTDPTANFEAIEALRALERPFQTAAFTDKNYNALGPAVVNDLFLYVMNVERLWHEFTVLANMSLSQTARTQLPRDLADLQHAQDYGAVLRRTEDGQLVAEIAFLEVGEPDATTGQPVITARPARGAQGIAVQVYSGAIEENGDQPAVEAPAIGTNREYAVLIDGPGSRGTMGEQMSLGAKFMLKIAEISQLLTQTIEVQGRITAAIENALREAGAGTTPTE